jgi:hypothetical protein
MCYYGYHDGDKKRSSAEKLETAIDRYRRRARYDPRFPAIYGDEPTFVLTSLEDAEELVAAGVPLDVRGDGGIQRGCLYLNREGGAR